MGASCLLVAGCACGVLSVLGELCCGGMEPPGGAAEGRLGSDAA